jgi:tRNA A37 threonylcarbamoyltransferase TsaD
LRGGQGHQARRRRAKQRDQQQGRRCGNAGNFQQLSILGTEMGHSTEEWEDKLLEKREGVCRVGLLNPSGLTLMGGSAKNDQLRELMKKMEVDIMCLPEVNICWHKLSPRNRLEERTMGWFETLHQLVAYNYQD